MGNRNTQRGAAEFHTQCVKRCETVSDNTALVLPKEGNRRTNVVVDANDLGKGENPWHERVVAPTAERRSGVSSASPTDSHLKSALHMRRLLSPPSSLFESIICNATPLLLTVRGHHIFTAPLVVNSTCNIALTSGNEGAVLDGGGLKACMLLQSDLRRCHRWHDATVYCAARLRSLMG